MLDRQLSRLKKLILKYHHEQLQPVVAAAPPRKKQREKEMPAFDLFSSFDEVAPVAELTPSPSENYRGGSKKEVPNLRVMPNEWKVVIHDKLQELIQSGQTHTTALQMAHYVARVFGHDRDLYLTGKPRTYYWVASYMDTLPTLEVLEASLEDITYKVKAKAA